MVETRNGANTSDTAGHNQHNQHCQPPPPPPTFVNRTTPPPQQQYQSQAPPHYYGQPNRSILLNEFCKRRPPVFTGDVSLGAAEAWLKQTQKLLHIMQVPDNGDRVALATYQLQGEADYWWDLVKTTHDDETMDWETFKTLFLAKYFPTPMKQALVLEFLNLRQGNRTVTQYAARFEELSRHAPEHVATDATRARKFEWGLSPYIRKGGVTQRE